MLIAAASASQLMGWLADRIGAERVLVSGFCVWSIATVLTGLATGFAMLFAFRLLMGTGEAVAYPSAAKLLATHVEPRHRARSRGSVVLGAIVGLTVGAFLGGWLLGHYGWRTMLITLGGASLLWLIPRDVADGDDAGSRFDLHRGWRRPGAQRLDRRQVDREGR